MQLSQISMQLLFETLTAESGRADRRCRAEYELFNYSIIFTEILFRNFNSGKLTALKFLDRN